MSHVIFLVHVLLVVLSHGPLVVFTKNCNDPIMFVFGDSNSDTGASSAAFGSLPHYPTGNIFPYPPSDRESDGRLVIDFLCENVTTSYLKAYLNSLEPNIGNGANFAMSGSTATFPSFALKTQIFQFERYYNRSLELLKKGSSYNLVNKEGFKRALYLIDIGQNDLSKSFGNGSYDELIGRIPNITFEIKKAVKDIYEVGGRRFWVHNTGPLGCLPFYLSTMKPNSSDLDQHGCIKYLNKGAQRYNKHLFTLCKELRHEMKNATIVYVDMYAIKYDLIANASQYGFENPLTACHAYNLETGSFSLCADQSKHISWDGTHYTDAANSFVSSKIISAEYSTPPFPFNFFCDSSFT